MVRRYTCANGASSLISCIFRPKNILKRERPPVWGFSLFHAKGTQPIFYGKDFFLDNYLALSYT